MRTGDTLQTAVVAAVEEKGLILQFPHESGVSSRHYKYNRAVEFAVGDRVLLLPSGGSYIAAFPI